MLLIVVSLIFDQLKTVLINCLQSITLLQIKCCFTLKMNSIAISIESSLHVAMYMFVNRKSCKYNFVLNCIVYLLQKMLTPKGLTNVRLTSLLTTSSAFPVGCLVGKGSWLAFVYNHLMACVSAAILVLCFVVYLSCMLKML